MGIGLASRCLIGFSILDSALLAVPLALLSLLAVAYGVRLLPGRLGRGMQAQIDAADQLRKTDPKEAQKTYDRIIQQLQELEAERPLQESARVALGRAYCGAALTAVEGKRTAEGMSLFKLARQCIALDGAEFVPTLAAAFIGSGDVSDDALRCYAAYLALPMDKADEPLAISVARLLEKELEVVKGLSREQLQRRVQWHKLLTRIPVAVPCLVVVEADPTRPVRQYALGAQTNFGRGETNSITVADNSVCRAHASIERRDDSYILVSHSTINGTRLRGTLIKEPTALQDGDEILCGLTALYFFSKPRQSTLLLGWPHYHLGVACFHQGLFDVAEEELTLADAQVPRKADTLWMLGLTAQARGSTPRALQYFEEAVALDPEHAQAHYAWGLALVRLWTRGLGAPASGSGPSLRQPDDVIIGVGARFHQDASAFHPALNQQVLGSARESLTHKQALRAGMHHLQAAVEAAPQDVECLYNLARAQAFVGDYVEAIKLLERAIEVEGDRIDCHLFLANLTRKTGDIPRSQKAVNAALVLDEESLPGNWMAGCNAFDIKEYEQAVACLERLRATELCRGKADFSGTAVFGYRLGRALFETGRYEPAAQALLPVGASARDAHFYSGRCQARLGRPQAAAAIYQQLLQNNAADAEVRFYLAATYANLAEYDKALQTVEPLEADSGWAARAACLAGKAFARTGRLDEASAKFEAALRLNRGGVELRLEAGRLAFLRGAYADAEQSFRIVLEEDDRNVLCRYWLAQSQLAQGKRDLARHHLVIVVLAGAEKTKDEEMRTLLANAHFSLGWLALQHDEGGGEALRCFTEARLLGGSQVHLAFHAAIANGKCGKHTEAVAELSALSLRNDLQPQQAQAVVLALGLASLRAALQHMQAESYHLAVPLLKQALVHLGKQHSESARVIDALAEAHYGVGLQSLCQGLQSGPFKPAPRTTSTVSARARSSAFEQLDNANQAFSCARDLSPRDPRFVFHAGFAQFLLGDFTGAVECFRAVEGDGMWTTVAREGVALALEMSQGISAAEAIWSESVRSVNGNWDAKHRCHLGYVGFLVRQDRMKDAAAILKCMLNDQQCKAHPAYQQYCKLAVAYFNLAGESRLAAEIVHEHLSGVAPDVAESFLGAMWAQQGKLAEALARLRRALKGRAVPPAAVRELFLAVSSALAAREVIEGRWREAQQILDLAVAEGGGLGKDGARLHSRVRTVVSLDRIGKKPPAELLKDYERVCQEEPNNVRLKRNLAILHHKAAITLEEQGSTTKADRHWKQATDYWRRMVDDDGFWSDYMQSYNENRHSRDRLKAQELDLVRHNLLTRVADVNAAFAVAYARSAATASSSTSSDGYDIKPPFTEVRRHARYATALLGTDDYRKTLAAMLMGLNAELRNHKNGLLQLLEIIHTDIMPDEDKVNDLHISFHTDHAVDAIWEEQISHFQRHMKKIAEMCSDTGDLKAMARNAASSDHHFLSRLARLTKTLISQVDGLNGQTELQKLVLYQMVLQTATLIAGLDYARRGAVQENVELVVPRLFEEVLRHVLQNRQRRS